MAHANVDNDGAHGPIINEVLCFIMNKWGHIDLDTLTKLCFKFNEKDIEAAKDLLFSFLHDENSLTEFKRRRHGTGKNGLDKKTRMLEDIFKLLEEKGDAEIPDFVALDLSKLPPITFDNIDVSVLLQKLNTMEFTVKTVKESMNKVMDAHTVICLTNEELYKKVCELETKSVNVPNNTVICTVCNSKLPSEKDYQVHMNSHKELLSHPSTHSEENKYKCLQCAFACDDDQQLNQHMVKHTKKDQFACDKCDFKCDEEVILSQHNASHVVEKPFKCNDCDLGCDTDMQLKQHMKSHTGEKPFVCTKCDFKCDDESELRNHMTSLDKETPIKCEDCMTICGSETQFKQHMLTHKGRMPIVNKVGSNKCDYKTQLEQYKINQKAKVGNLGKGINPTGNKTYLCHVCDQSFTSQTECKDHIKAHNEHTGKRLFLCCMCNNNFDMAWSLKEHMSLHESELPFSCTFCDYKCSDAVKMKEHKEMHTAGWSYPIYNGKPLNPKMYNKPKPVMQTQSRGNNNNKSMAIIGTGKSTNHAIQNKKHLASIFATRYEPTIEGTSVKNELEAKLLKVTGVKHIVTVEKLKARYDHYASFKISCSCDNTAVFTNPDIWGKGILIRWWKSPRNDNNVRNKHYKSNRS